MFRSLLISSVAVGLLLLLFFFTAPLGWPSILNLFVISVASSVLVVNLQLRLMEVAGDAQTVGAAMNHASLNIANALGAWLGGLVIAAGFGYTAPALVGAVPVGAGRRDPAGVRPDARPDDRRRARARGVAQA